MDIPVHEPGIGEPELSAIRETVSEGWVSPSGPVVEEFEQDIASFLDAEHVLATDSGTAALHLALLAAGIGAGDEVIVQDFTYGVTGTAVLAAGATPRLVDVERDMYALDPEATSDAITDETAGIVISHMFGRPGRIEQLRTIADEYEIPLIEDAAQAFGSEAGGACVGTIGDVGCFSFSWNKPVSTGKGGAVVTDDDGVAELMQELSDYGRDHSNPRRFVRPGYNYRIDSIRASIGRERLAQFESIGRRTRNICRKYNRRLDDLPVTPVFGDPAEKTVPFLYMIQTDDRDALASHLAEHGIDTRKAYQPLHTMPAFDANGSYPVSTVLSDTLLGLPSSPTLTDNEIGGVCDALKAFFKHT